MVCSQLLDFWPSIRAWADINFLGHILVRPYSGAAKQTPMLALSDAIKHIHACIAFCNLQANRN